MLCEMAPVTITLLDVEGYEAILNISGSTTVQDHRQSRTLNQC